MRQWSMAQSIRSARPVDGPTEEAFPPREGFTLVEILVALAVAGILATLAMFRISSYRDQTVLRQAAESLHQDLSWAKLQAEKTGDTILVKIALPWILVYRDANGSGKWESTDLLLRSDSLGSTVKLLKPAAAPIEAPTVPLSGLADGTGTCGGGVCCTKGAGAPGWSDSVVNFCARNSPRLPPLEEDGGVYLASTNARVPEMWAIVANRAKSTEPTLWSSEQAPAAASDWRKIR